MAEFQTPSLMHRKELEQIWWDFQTAIDESGVRRLILDFHRVEFLSSQAVGIVMALHNKLSRIDDSLLILCGVRPALMDLLKVVGLIRVLRIERSLADAVKRVQAAA